MRKYLRQIARYNMLHKYGMERINHPFYGVDRNGNPCKSKSVFSQWWKKYVGG